MTLFLAVLAIAGTGLLTLAWLLYPALMVRRASRIALPAAALPAELPSVSVILVTKDPPSPVRARLQDLLRTTYPLDRLEVIVAFDGIPQYPELRGSGATFSRMVLTDTDPPGGKACGLNSAVRKAEGRVLIFADTHQQFEPDAIPRLVARITSGPWSVVSGALHLDPAGGTANPLTGYWARERQLREAEALVHSSIGVTGAIYAMWRSDWTPVPAGLILDDLFIPMRRVLAGERIGFEPSAIARDTRATSPAQEFRRKVRTLTGNIQLCAWLPQVLSPRANPVWIAFLCHKLLRLLTPYCLAAALVGLAGLGVLIVPAASRVLLAVALLALAGTVLSPRLRSALAWGITLQGAVIVAAVNGLRGNWNVWHKPSNLTGGGR